MPKVLVISPDGRENSATIQQDADVYRLRLKVGEKVEHILQPHRGLWLQIISGKISINENDLNAGDALSSEDAGAFHMTALENSEALLFDLA